MNIQYYIDRINASRDEDEGEELVYIQGGVSKKAIKTIEKKIGVTFPKSYRDFLEEFGSIQECDNCILGIDDYDPLNGQGIYTNTVRMRKAFEGQYEVPKYLWLLEEHEDGGYCFNFKLKTQKDEFAIVNYEPHLPSNTFEKPVASTFHEYLKERYYPFSDGYE